jgi:hypothetical protein
MNERIECCTLRVCLLDHLNLNKSFFTVHNTTLLPPVEKDSYVIENDLYVKIRLLKLILYYRFCVVWVIFIGGMGSIRVLSEMQNGMGSIRVTG